MQATAEASELTGEQRLERVEVALSELGRHVAVQVGFGMRAPSLQAIIDDVKARGE